MKTTKKALLLALCAVLLVVSTVFATMAYLTSTTKVVTNTFTVGNVKITLDEAPVNEYGKVVEGDRRTENTYKLIPGHSYTKDPTIHVVAGSEECWLFVKVSNPLVDIIASKTISEQMETNGWRIVDAENNIWANIDKVDARTATAAIDVPVFGSFTITNNANVADYNGMTITVQAYAIQADGFDTYAEAWEAAPSSWTPDAN